MALDLPSGLSLQHARDSAAHSFEAAGIDTAREDATTLLCEAAGISRAGFIANAQTAMDERALRKFSEFAERRLGREPVTRIIGRRGFWTLDLEVAPDVLDPRADSETLITAALEILGSRKSAPLKILDLGCGSGALICALLQEFPQAHGTAVDISPAACALTRRNAAANSVADRLTVIQCTWQDCPHGPYDLLVSNPPYIRTQDMPGLDAEVRLWDPELALDGGADGLQAYRTLADQIPGLLTVGGWLIYETGYDQAARVTELLNLHGIRDLMEYRDIGGHVRAVVGQI